MQHEGSFFSSPSKDCIRIASTWIQCVVCGSQIILDLRVPQHSFTRQTVTALIFPFQQLQYPGTMGWVKVKDVVSALTRNVLALAPSQILNIIFMLFFFIILRLCTLKTRAGVTYVTAVHTFEGRWINTGFILQEEPFWRTQNTSWWRGLLVGEVGSWRAKLCLPCIWWNWGDGIGPEDQALCSPQNSELSSGYLAYGFVCIELSVSSHPLPT